MVIKIQLKTRMNEVVVNGMQQDTTVYNDGRYQSEITVSENNSHAKKEALLQIEISYTEPDVRNPHTEDEIQEHTLRIKYTTTQSDAPISAEVHFPSCYLENRNSDYITVIKSQCGELTIPYFMDKSNARHLDNNINEILKFVFYFQNEQPIIIEIPFRKFQNY